MSGNKIFKSTMLKSSIVVGASVVALTLGACASSGGSGSRYGNVYDYESGGNCNAGASCGAVVTPPVDTRYGSSTTVIGGQPVSPGAVYVDCSQTAMGCGAPVTVSAPPVAYSPPSMQQSQSSGYTSPPSMSYSGGAVSCPPNTTPAGDGSCMMSGSGSYSGSTTYNSGSTSTYTGSSNTSYGEAVSCPSGTTKASDGTCMMSGSGSYTGSSSSYSSGSTPTYSGSSSASGGTVDCPSGTTRASDGTCMMSSGSSNVTIYPTTGYVPPVDYTAPVYEPPRK